MFFIHVGELIFSLFISMVHVHCSLVIVAREYCLRSLFMFFTQVYCSRSLYMFIVQSTTMTTNRELEGRVQQLSMEVEGMHKECAQLERRRAELDALIKELRTELIDNHSRAGV